VEITVLGAGTLLPDDRRRSPGHLVETERARVLLDCGSGTLHGLDREGRDWFGITHVAISHFHTDHFGDLAPLLWAWKHAGREGPDVSRTLLGPPGFRRVLEALAEAHGEFVLDPGAPLRVVELERADRWEDPGLDLAILTHPTPHTAESVAFRVESGEGFMGYTGDTGPSTALGTFLRGLGVLIAECALPDHVATDGHLTPSTAAELAVAADPEILILTHFYPQLDPGPLPDLIRAGGYTGTVHAGHDGLTVRTTGR
jgi:ribonuclease BN (tRNA processing enzyme)